MTSIEKTDLLLLLLYSKGATLKVNEPITGMTRLTKLLFLLEKETDINESFKFEPYKMGPFSSELYAEIDFLQNFPSPERSLLETKYPESSENQLNLEQLKYIDDLAEKEEAPFSNPEANATFFLTEIGQKVAQKLWEQQIDEVKVEIENIKKKYAGLSLRQLLKYVYDNYPDMTINSEIKEKING